MVLKGKIASNQVLRLRFPGSGKLGLVNFKVGDRVKRGQLLAQQNQSELQARLDRELKQYEKARANFEENSNSDLNEFERTQRQASLDIAVKEVELAKHNLEDTNLYAPTAGQVIEADPGVVGMNITPAAFTVTLLADGSFYFSTYIKEEAIPKLKLGQEVDVKLDAYPEKKLDGIVSQLGAEVKKGKLPVIVSITSETKYLYLGLSGEINLG